MNIGQPSASSDLTPLSWVQEEVRRQLEAVNKVLRRQLREFDLRQAGGQLDAAALASVLQTQALQLHQVSGVLRLVNLDEGHRLMQAAESLLVRCAGDATLRTEQVEAVERAGFALLTYMTRSVSGARPSPLALFPAYRRLQELNQAERIHPADFWPQHFEWRTLPPPQLVDAGLPSLDALRTSFEGALLRQMRETSATHAASLAELCAGIGLALRREPQQSFWQLAAAHFEAQAQGMLASDQLVKRMASRLLAQLRDDLRGSTEVSDRLVQDLLFFCAQSGEPKPGQAPRLRAVRAAYGIDEAEIGDYRDDSLGRIDPAWVQQAMRRVSAAKEAWSACAEGDMVRAAALDDASGHLAESLVQLFAGGEHLGQTLQRAAVVTLRSGGRPPAALAMEVASALLYLEAALEDGEYDQPSQRTRIERLAQRVQAAATGKPEEQLESWMEDLFRRVGDRQTLGSVMQELRANLGEVERATDEYFRDPTRRAALIPVPGQLQAMRGVFTVLGLDDAATTCVRMRDEIDRLSNTEVDASLAGPRAVFERLATNLGQLGFLIDMLSVQAPLAKSMFRFDEEKGELVAAVGREKRSFDAPAPVAPAPAFEDTRPLDVSGPETAAPAAAPLRPLGLDELDLPDLELPDLELPLSEAASAAEASRWSDSLQNAATEPMPLDAVLPVREPAESLPSFSLDLSSMPSEPPSAAPSMAPVVAAIPAPAAPEASDAEDIDAEMLEIFLEEALEVVGNARRALEGLREQPADRAEFTNLRRAFHTLKGSGRMVGLNAFGEGAWACEQLFNARLGSEAPADAALLNFAAQALDELDAWRGELAEGGGAARSPQGLRERADRLRLGELAAAAVEAPALPVAPAVLPDEPTVEQTVEQTVELPLDATLDEAVVEAVEPDLALDLALASGTEEGADAPSDTLPMDLVEEQPEAVPDLDLDLDLDIETAPAFDATQALEVQVAEPAELSVDIPLISLEESVEFPAEPIEQAVTLDLDLPEPAPIVQAEALPDLVLDLGDEPAWEGEPDETVSAAATLDATQAPEASVLDLLGEEPLPLDEIVPAEQAEPPAEEAAQALAQAPAEERSEVEVEAQPEVPVEAQTEPAEAMVQIGDISVSEALLRIFTAEADEQSQRLCDALEAWSQGPGGAPPSNAEVYAHALAGNAATVGHQALSQLARALEHALGRAQQAVRVADEPAAHFGQAAQAIRALLARFGAGELARPDAALLEALHAYQPELADEAEDSDLAPLAALAAPAVELEADFPLGEADHIDLELWDIFEEEAGDLLQQLHARLRDWTQQPQDDARGDACMRTLHTFKGGARLAGAMQLGELAHLLESDVLTLLARAGRTLSELLPLQERGDELEQRFEALRREQHAAPAAPAAPTAPTAAELPSAAAVEPTAGPAPVEAASIAVEMPAAEAVEPSAEPELRLAAAPLVLRDPSEVDWTRFAGQEARELTVADAAPLVSGQSVVRVRAALLDRLASQAGEVSIRRARMENELAQMKNALSELDDNLERLRTQLRELELQAEAQISSRQEAARSLGSDFDPLEFDRYTRFQEVTRMLAESVNDVATVQRSLQRNVAAGEDELAAQSRLTRELQDDLLSSRMVEFESIAERLHRVVRQAGRESGKQVQLDIAGHGIELDRGVLERLIGAFEHLLRNAVVHGIETPEARKAAGKPEQGTIRIALSQEGNQVLIGFKDDGAGLNLARIREKALAQGLLQAGQTPADNELMQLIFQPGFSTAAQVTEMAGRGVGMDVVRAEVTTLGGYVLTRSTAGLGTEFDLRVPLTTALTQVVLLRVGELQVAVPASLVDSVLRLPNADLVAAYDSGRLKAGLGAKAVEVPIYWLGGLLAHNDHPQLHGKHAAVVLVHSGPDRIAIHVDEVVGNQEVVVKNLGPQLIHVPGLAGISLLASGSVALIYNPVALAERYGAAAVSRARLGGVPIVAAPVDQRPLAPLIMVVDDSLTVRRVSQRFLEREGLRVQLAKDGLDAMEQLAREELPDLILSDIEMPRMDGFDLVRNIRADARLKKLPVVMITSRIAEKHRDYAAQLGVQGYLGKPYDEETLLRLIRQHTATAPAAALS